MDWVTGMLQVQFWVEYFSYFLMISIALALSGLLYDRFWLQRQRRAGDVWANIFILLIGEFAHYTFLGLICYWGMVYFEPYRIYSFKPTLFNWLLCYIVVDFSYYWRHRLQHKVTLFWVEHSVHHSSKEVNLSTGLRMPWLMIPYAWVIFIPMILLGFPAFMAYQCFIVNLLYQMVIHRSDIRKGHWFIESVLNTPSHHRVHHGQNPEYIHKNFAGTFIFWDRMFGTFCEETIPADYGAGYEMKSHNPFYINFYPVYYFGRQFFTKSLKYLKS